MVDVPTTWLCWVCDGGEADDRDAWWGHGWICPLCGYYRVGVPTAAMVAVLKTLRIPFDHLGLPVYVAARSEKL